MATASWVRVTAGPRRALPCGGRLAVAVRDQAGDPARAARLFEAPGAEPAPRPRGPAAAAAGEGFYTIGSAGHESNAAVALALRPTDPALLHYRSGGFYCARAAQVAGHDPVARRAARPRPPRADDPISGGRHKVFGHAGPARHPADLDDRLPPAARGRPRLRARTARARLGVADAVAGRRRRGGQLRRRLGQPLHGGRRAQRGGHAVAPGLAVPLLFVCEDNGIGITVPHARRAGSRRRCRRRPRLRLPARPTARDPPRRSPPPREAADRVRAHAAARRCCTCGPCGSWATPAPTPSSAYRSAARLAADLARDPLLGTARRWSTPAGRPGPVLARYDAARAARSGRTGRATSSPPSALAAAAEDRVRVARRTRGRPRDRAPSDRRASFARRPAGGRAGRSPWPSRSTRALDRRARGLPAGDRVRRGRRRARAACTA